MRRIVDWAEANPTVPVQIHLAEMTSEMEWAERTHGCRPVEVVDRAGLLREGLIAAHCLYLNDAEIDRLAETGVRVAHNARSNAKAGRGIAPVEAMRCAGIPVGVATDGRRVGTMDCSIAPLTEPDMRTTHPALWIGPSKCQLKLGRYLRGVKFHPSGFQRYQSSCEPGNRIGPRHARTVGLVPNTPAAIRGTGGSPAARPHCQKMPEKEAGSLLLTHDDSSVSIRRRPPVVLFDFVADLGPWN